MRPRTQPRGLLVGTPLGALPRMRTSFDDTCPGVSPTSAANGTIALAVRFSSYSAQQVRYVQVYGHVWGVIEAFFCLVRSREQGVPLQVVYLPSHGFNDRNEPYALFVELAAAFDGPALSMHRVGWLPVCWQSCCELSHAAASARTVGATLHTIVIGDTEHNPAMNSHRGVAPRRELRAALWASLRVPAAQTPDVFLFASSRDPENKRWIAKEGQLVKTVRSHVAARYPQLRFEHSRLQARRFAPNRHASAATRDVCHASGCSRKGA